MLRIVTFNSRVDLLESSDESAILSSSLVVCPSPAIADGVRTLLNARKVYPRDVITIAKYIKDKLSQINLDSHFLEKKKLKIMLATLWCERWEKLDYSDFTSAFNVLTEMRGHTLDTDALTSIIGHQKKIIQDSVLLFAHYMHNLGVIDEHSAYIRINDIQSLSDAHESVVFWGFKHLSGVQVDHIASLSKKQPVSVYAYKAAYEHQQDNHWIAWLRENEHQHIDLGRQKKLVNIPCSYFHPGRMAETMSSIDAKEIDMVILGGSDCSVDQYLEIPFKEFSYKASHNIFVDVLDVCIQQWRDQIFKEKSTIQTQDLLSFLNLNYQKVLVSSADERFRLYKIHQLMIEAVELWASFAPEAQQVDESSFQILIDYVNSSLPRNYFISSTNTGREKKAIDLSSLVGLEGKKGILCLSRDYHAFNTVEKYLPAEIEKLLVQLSPLRNIDLENTILRSELYDLLANCTMKILIERGMTSESKWWSDFFAELILNDEELDYVKRSKKESLFCFGAFETKDVSSQKIQSFLDCPRKFWANYVCGLKNEVDLQQQVPAVTLGKLEHEIVEKYCEQYDRWNEDEYKNFFNDYWKNFTTLKPHVPSVAQMGARYEVFSYAKSGIKQALEIINALDLSSKKAEEDLKFTCERALEHYGRVDFLAQNEEQALIVDFKRSPGGIPSKSEFFDYRKIQMTYYLYLARKIIVNKKITAAYICLADKDNSVLFSSDQYSRKKLSSMGLTVIDFDDAFIDGFSDTVSQWYEKVSKEGVYEPIPSQPNVCKFCDINLICEGSLYGR